MVRSRPGGPRLVEGLRRHRRARGTRATRSHFAELLRRHLSGRQTPVDDLVGYLDYLGGLGRFAFHGSGDAGLGQLGTERKSGDSRAFGRQRAVYATPDPHWAAFFALVNREQAATIRNFSIGLHAHSRSRWYRRDVVLTDPAQPPARPGWLYVLPPEGFHAAPRRFGPIDVAHWVSHEPVRPLFALPLTPGTYPLARYIRAR